MLEKLTTKNFRKLTDHTFNFTEGLNVILGDNEQGKSTMLEAFGYLLNGTSALRDPIEHVVTWGQPVNTLSVEGVLVFDGVRYNAKRSKRGAEITYGDQRVVGQKECTAFFARLLGADPKVAAKLIMAKQGEIRGALDSEGEAVKLIEKLANFDIIDYVLELVTTHRVTGPTASAEDRVTRCEQAVEAAKAAVVEPDVDTAQDHLSAYRAELADLVVVVDGALKVQHDEHLAELNRVTRSRDRGAMLSQQLNAAITNRAQWVVQRDDAQVASEKAPHPDELSRAEAQLEAGRSVLLRLAAYEKVQKFARSYPDAFWDEGPEALQVAIDDARAAAERIRIEHAEMNGEISALEKQKKGSGSDTCGACGQKLPDAEARAKHLAELQDKLTGLYARRGGVATAMQEASDEHAALLAVQRSGAAYDLLAAEMGDLVEVNRMMVPCEVTWKGEPPQPVDVSDVQMQIRTLKRQGELAAQAAARVDVLAQQITQCDADIDRLQAEMAQCTCTDAVAIAQMNYDRVNSEYQMKYGRVSELRFHIGQLQNEVDAAQAVYQQQMLAVSKAEEELQRANNDLKTLIFNNDLLKKVRAARPVISDKLWTVVLSAVSNYFSAMRGQQSIITREGNEFMCDGKPIAGGLSGSALDLLGLSIRMALSQTFLPTTSFLSLDEPAAAMSEGRTKSMLGFLVGAGFEQTLLVTHDEVSETVAQNLITI
jgi:DNA repair exonuclease SbcCD ATPase subunit